MPYNTRKRKSAEDTSATAKKKGKVKTRPVANVNRTAAIVNQNRSQAVKLPKPGNSG